MKAAHHRRGVAKSRCHSAEGSRAHHFEELSGQCLSEALITAEAEAELPGEPSEVELLRSALVRAETSRRSRSMKTMIGLFILMAAPMAVDIVFHDGEAVGATRSYISHLVQKRVVEP